jgi:hypothetical protein
VNICGESGQGAKNLGLGCRKVEPGAENGLEGVILSSTAHLEPSRAVVSY